MYKNEFDNHIRNNSLSNSFVLFGESSFFIDRYIKILTKPLKDISMLSFYYDEYDFSSAKSHLNQNSLFGSNNLLIIKSEKKVPKKELDILIALCEKNKNNTFIYAYYGSDHKTYTKAFSKNSTMAVRFFNPKYNEAKSILLEEAKNNNVLIDGYLVTHLLQIHNNDIALAINEIEKLKVFDREITSKDIDNLVFGLAEIDIDEFIKKVLTKKDFRDDLLSLLEHGEDEIKIITSISSFITQLYMFNTYIKINGAPNALAILGYPAPPQIVKEKADLSLKFKQDKYYTLSKLLLESELKMKSSNVDKSAILISTLIRIQNIIS